MIRIQKVFTSREAMQTYIKAMLFSSSLLMDRERFKVRWKKRKHHEGYNFYLIDFQYKA